MHVNLYINTSGSLCEIALFQKGKVISKLIHEEPMQHSNVLHNLINELLIESDVTFQDLDCIALLNGPGSYTGLRIGLAAAKGFCYALDIPLILFNKLTILSSYFLEVKKQIEIVACIQTARQDEYFFTLQNRNEIVKAPLVQTTTFVNDIIENTNNLSIISPEEITLEDNSKPIIKIELPLAYMASQTANRLNNNQFDDLYSTEPFYLKKVHANVPKKRF